MAVKIFCCYAHEDEPLLNKLKTHLRPLQRAGLIDVWHDRDISAGIDWEQQIKEQLNTAQIILLLVSPDFMDSDYSYDIEMQRAIERHERGEARVIPIILRPVDFELTPFRKLQALPTDAKPVMSSSWQYQDEAFVNVTRGIRKVVQEQAHKAEEVKISRTNKTNLVITVLESPKFTWRTIEGVSEETQLPAEEVQKIISDLGEQVIKSEINDSKGRSLYTTRAHYKRRK